ncbi:MAG: HEPN domain-containing protein [Anaerolineaceae bacterium]|nr:HEPN domain-containing protein [Anaerolineaceae bacterium]
MNDKHEEWLKQANYDIETADLMFSGGRFFYAVFMCHLSIEKALKGLYHKTLDEIPPKTHNLIYLLNKIDKQPEENLLKFITRLNTASVTTRYPDDLAKIQAAFTAEVTKAMIGQSKDVLEWIKKQL